MSFNGENPYYDPEKCGLKIVEVLEDPNPCYDFDYFIVWETEKGDLYWASDSGCSCPTPFEDYRSLGDLDRLNNQTLPEFLSELDEWASQYEPEISEHKLNLIMKVRGRMK